MEFRSASFYPFVIGRRCASVFRKNVVTCNWACVTIALLSVSTAHQTTAQAPTPMQVQTRRPAQRPMKLDVHPLVAQARVGDKIPIEISLRDANNQLAACSRQCEVTVEVTGASGKTEVRTVTIPQGQSTAQLTINASEPGLLNFKAREADGTLLPGGNAVLVGPKIRAPETVKNTKKVTPSALPLPMHKGAHLITIAMHALEPTGSSEMHTGVYQQAAAVPQAAAPSFGLFLNNSSGKDGILSDGHDFARIQVYYTDSQGDPASSDITVWLSWSNGKLDPQPLVIKKGESVAEAHWTSLSPVAATVALVISAPEYPVAGPRELHVSFVTPIYGIMLFSANPLRLSLVDCEPVVAQFYDREKRPIQAGKPRNITFISSNPSLHLDPASRDVSPDESSASIFLVPTWGGSSTLDVSTPEYEHKAIQVEVTVWLVLLLCLSGGVIGGMAAPDAFKGAAAHRIFVGVLGAIVLVWISVFAILPQTHSIIAHNQVSVFVVAIIGGYGGTRVLDFAGKRLGIL